MVKALTDDFQFLNQDWTPNGDIVSGGCSNWAEEQYYHQWNIPQGADPRQSELSLLPPEDEKLSICAGCGEKICDRYYLYAVGRQWHVACLTCADCKSPLDSALTCFARDGNIYCKDDYYRRFTDRKCSRCNMGINTDEMVMRARELVYHVSCFVCHSCGKTLTTGEEFGMKDSLIYCRRDYENLYQGDFMYNFGDQLPSAQTPPYYSGMGTGVRRGRPRKRKGNPPEDNDECSLPGGSGLSQLDSLSGYMDIGGPDHGNLSARQKRVRTSFKHHQLRMMKSYFALNQNPDAKDLKQLSQKTGLPKRVLQVWFQNARAKYRRNILKQQDNQSHDLSRDMSEITEKTLDDLEAEGNLNVSMSSSSPVDLSVTNSNSSLNESFDS